MVKNTVGKQYIIGEVKTCLQCEWLWSNRKVVTNRIQELSLEEVSYISLQYRGDTSPSPQHLLDYPASSIMSVFWAFY